jgi:hypothetical protein
MGLLDDAIREHLELKRRRGADPDEVARQEDEALGAPIRGEFARSGDDEPEPAEDELAGADDDEVEAVAPFDAEASESTVDDTAEVGEEEPAPQTDEDVLEATPEFLEETPDHDRLWFEQKPPKDFDFDS